MNSDYSVGGGRHSFHFQDENSKDTIYFINDPEINNHLQFNWETLLQTTTKEESTLSALEI